MNTQPYVNRLIERQAIEGWTDAEMSRQIGIAQIGWQRIKRGERGIGLEVLRRSMRRFPEYDIDALSWLRSNGTHENGQH
jgi:transcriptional regulator with XRE-family HTH domain